MRETNNFFVNLYVNCYKNLALLHRLQLWRIKLNHVYSKTGPFKNKTKIDLKSIEFVPCSWVP